MRKADYRSQGNLKEAFDPELVRAYFLVESYGGKANIESVDSCITKLRVTVKDVDLVDQNKLKEQNYSGNLTIFGNYVVAIFGTASDPLKVRMQKIVRGEVDEVALKNYVSKLKDQTHLPEAEVSKAAPKPAQTQTSQKPQKVFSPTKGKVVLLDELEDESFRLLGEGVAIEPESQHFQSPLEKGTLELVYPAGHAYIFDQEGLKVLVHVGIETVRINSNKAPQEKLVAFSQFVQAGKQVEKAVTFLEVD